MAVTMELTGHEGDVNHCQWSPRDPLLISAGGDKVIRLWDVLTGKEHPSSPLRGHSYYVNACVLSPGGDLLATASSDTTVKLWSTATWTCIGSLNGHSGAVRMCCFSPDSGLLATASGDYTVRVWDVNTLNCLSVLDKHDSSVTSCSFAPVGWLLASGGSSGEVILFDVFAKKSKRKVEAHDLGVNWVEFFPCETVQNKLLLATAGQDNNVKLWNVVISQQSVTIQLKSVLSGHSGPVYSCQFSPSLQQMVSGSADNCVIVWDLASCKQVTKINAHTRYVTFCCFSPDGQRLSSTSNDRLIRIWSVKPSTQAGCTIVEPSAPPKQDLMTPSCTAPMEAVSEVCDWLRQVKENTQSPTDQSVVDRLQQAVQQARVDSYGDRNVGDDLKCPITQEPFKDPVVASDGFTYERSAFMSWLNEGKRTSPVTNLPLANTILMPNNTLKKLLNNI